MCGGIVNQSINQSSQFYFSSTGVGLLIRRVAFSCVQISCGYPSSSVSKFLSEPRFSRLWRNFPRPEEAARAGTIVSTPSSVRARGTEPSIFLQNIPRPRAPVHRTRDSSGVSEHRSPRKETFDAAAHSRAVASRPPK